MLSVQACGSNQGETRLRYTSAPKRGRKPPSLPAFRFHPTCRGKTVILYQYQGYTDARKNPFSLYHCLSCCCHMLCMHHRAQNSQNLPNFSENEAKEPLFPGYRRRQSKNSEKARSTGNPLGRRGGRAASLLDSVEDGRNLFALVRLLGSQTTTGDNRCRVTSAQERPRVGRFLRPARNQFFIRKSDFTQAEGRRGQKN